MPRPKKGEGKDKGAQKERTEEELKNSPTFHKFFYQETLKEATDAEEKAKINRHFQESSSHDDFSMRLFEIDWFLEKYEDIFNSTKNSMKAKKEEPVPVPKVEAIQQPKIDADRDQTMYPQPTATYDPNYYTQYSQQPGVGSIYSRMAPQNYMPQEQYPSYPSRDQPMYQSYSQPSQLPPQMQTHMQMPIQTQPASLPQAMSQSQPLPITNLPAQPPTQTQIPPNRGMVDKEEPRNVKEPSFQTEFETNPQLRQKLNSGVPLNYPNLMNFIHNKVNKKYTDPFMNGLYFSVMEYAKNLLDDLRNICEMDNDSMEMKSFMKTSGGSAPGMDSEATKNSLMGMEGPGEIKAPKPHQYLVKFSSLQEDQKQIEKLDSREQTELEERYTMSKDDDEEKITKKVKKDFTEEDEIIKLLFKTKKDKNQDTEDVAKKIHETNQFLSKITARHPQPTAPHLQDTMLQREPSGKGRKSTSMQKRVSMKHLIYYLETNALYKRTPLLHKAYLK